MFSNSMNYNESILKSVFANVEGVTVETVQNQITVKFPDNLVCIINSDTYLLTKGVIEEIFSLVSDSLSKQDVGKLVVAKDSLTATFIPSANQKPMTNDKIAQKIVNFICEECRILPFDASSVRTLKTRFDELATNDNRFKQAENDDEFAIYLLRLHPMLFEINPKALITLAVKNKKNLQIVSGDHRLFRILLKNDSRSVFQFGVEAYNLAPNELLGFLQTDAFLIKVLNEPDVDKLLYLAALQDKRFAQSIAEDKLLFKIFLGKYDSPLAEILTKYPSLIRSIFKTDNTVDLYKVRKIRDHKDFPKIRQLLLDEKKHGSREADLLFKNFPLNPVYIIKVKTNNSNFDPSNKEAWNLNDTLMIPVNEENLRSKEYLKWLISSYKKQGIEIELFTGFCAASKFTSPYFNDKEIYLNKEFALEDIACKNKEDDIVEYSNSYGNSYTLDKLKTPAQLMQEYLYDFSTSMLMQYCEELVRTNPAQYLDILEDPVLSAKLYEYERITLMQENPEIPILMYHRGNDFLMRLSARELESLCKLVAKDHLEFCVDIFSNAQLFNRMNNGRALLDLVSAHPSLAYVVYTMGQEVLEKLEANILAKICSVTANLNPEVSIDILSHEENRVKLRLHLSELIQLNPLIQNAIGFKIRREIRRIEAQRKLIIEAHEAQRKLKIKTQPNTVPSKSDSIRINYDYQHKQIICTSAYGQELKDGFPVYIPVFKENFYVCFKNLNQDERASLEINCSKPGNVKFTKEGFLKIKAGPGLRFFAIKTMQGKSPHDEKAIVYEVIHMTKKH